MSRETLSVSGVPLKHPDYSSQIMSRAFKYDAAYSRSYTMAVNIHSEHADHGARMTEEDRLASILSTLCFSSGSSSEEMRLL